MGERLGSRSRNRLGFRFNRFAAIVKALVSSEQSYLRRSGEVFKWRFISSSLSSRQAC